jgi:hypothetical protein
VWTYAPTVLPSPGTPPVPPGACDDVLGGAITRKVVLARNPLANLANLKSVVVTVKRGVVFERRRFVPLVAGDITDL